MFDLNYGNVIHFVQTTSIDVKYFLFYENINSNKPGNTCNESLKFKSIAITYQGYYPLHLPVLSGSSTDLEGDTNRCDDGVQLLRFSPWDLIGECSTLEVFRLSTRD